MMVSNLTILPMVAVVHRHCSYTNTQKKMGLINWSSTGLNRIDRTYDRCDVNMSSDCWFSEFNFDWRSAMKLNIFFTNNLNSNTLSFINEVKIHIWIEWYTPRHLQKRLMLRHILLTISYWLSKQCSFVFIYEWIQLRVGPRIFSLSAFLW